MIIYDTANRLAQEIKQSEEYINYNMAKEALNTQRISEKTIVFLKARHKKPDI